MSKKQKNIPDQADIIGENNSISPRSKDISNLMEKIADATSNHINFLSREEILDGLRSQQISFRDIPLEFRADKKIVLEVLKNFEDSLLLEFASPKLRADREVVLMALSEDYHYVDSFDLGREEWLKRLNCILSFAAPTLKHDRTFIL